MSVAVQRGQRDSFRTAGEKLGAYQGLDGVFDSIWEALEGYPEWTVLILDEIAHIQHDANYDPNEFFYRLQRRRSTPRGCEAQAARSKLVGGADGQRDD